MIGPSRKVKGSSEATSSLGFRLIFVIINSSIFVLKPLKLVFIVISRFTLFVGPVIKNKYQEEKT